MPDLTSERSGRDGVNPRHFLIAFANVLRSNLGFRA
jgi:hypothetical protein